MLKHTIHSLQMFLINLRLTIVVEVSVKLQTSVVHYSNPKPVSCSVPFKPWPCTGTASDEEELSPWWGLTWQGC